MTFEEQSAEFARLKAAGKSMGLSDAIVDRILSEVTADAQRSSVVHTAEQTLDEIRP